MAGLVIDDGGNLVDQAESEQVRLAALGLLLDRRFGKPTAATVVAGGDSGAVEKTLRKGKEDEFCGSRRVAFLLTWAIHQQNQEATE